MTRALLPWLLGFVGLGVGYPIVGDTAWLFAFVIPAFLLGVGLSLRPMI